MNDLETNCEYKHNLRKWQMVRDCVNDEVKQKACRNASCEYERTADFRHQGYIVRAPGIEDEAYYTFANRAVFKNYTGNTLDILCGAAMMRPYKLTGESVDDTEQPLPESIQYIEDSFTRSGIGYYDSLKGRIREVSSVGRFGLWADFPSNTEGMTQKEIRDKGLFARAQGFKAEDIKDWSEAIINGRKQLNYVKLSECYTQMVVSGSDFKREAFTVTYELFLDEEGLYSVKRDDGTTVNIYSPTLGNGQRLDWIPFQFYGSIENTPSVDPLPMFKISEINIALFNNDATFRQAMWYFGAPTATFALSDGVSISEFQKANGLLDGESPTFGGSAYVGCEIGLAQISVDSMLIQAMDKDVESMAQIGAQIISTGGNETAEAARIRKSSSMASLGGIVANIEAGDRNVINWMMMFNNESGQPDEFMLELNRKFYDERIEPQMLQQLVTMNFQGKLPDEYLFKVLKDNKFALDGDSIVEYIERIGDIPNTGINLDEE
jgi:hypothetical protein